MVSAQKKEDITKHHKYIKQPSICYAPESWIYTFLMLTWIRKSNDNMCKCIVRNSCKCAVVWVMLRVLVNPSRPSLLTRGKYTMDGRLNTDITHSVVYIADIILKCIVNLWRITGAKLVEFFFKISQKHATMCSGLYILKTNIRNFHNKFHF